MNNVKEIASVKTPVGAFFKGAKIGSGLRSQIKEGNFEGNVFYTVLFLSIIKDGLDFVALAAAAAAAEAAASAGAAAVAAGTAAAAGGTAVVAGATGLGAPVAAGAGILAVFAGYVAAGLTVTVGTLVGSATSMEVFVELVNITISVILFIVFFRQTSWLKKYLFKRFVWPWIIEFIPIINYFPTYTFMTILLKLKVNKQNKKREEEAELYGEEAYA